MDENEFKRLLEPAAWSGEGHGRATRQAASDVGDTLYLCAAWWRTYGRGITPSAADLLTMCEMVLREQETILRREQENLDDL